METLTVRVYNVLFGDGIFVSVPDKDEHGNPLTRHILIDVGNASASNGGENSVFKQVFDDVLKILGGQPLDLYVLTHEHLDHVQGPLWAENHAYPNESLKEKLNVQHAWLPASSAPDYYTNHPDAKKRLDLASEAFFEIDGFLTCSDETSESRIHTLARMNNRFLGPSGTALQLSHGRTADCVEYVRGLAGDNTHYVHRSVGRSTDTFDLTGKHPFRATEFEIWAPEEDTADYYGRFQPVALTSSKDTSTDVAPAELLHKAQPPAGVDAGAFYNLIDLRSRGYLENLLTLDKAANNSSIVFCIKWRGWRLLFTGDAEIRSWREMNKEGALGAVHFIKVSHHESHNGTPEHKILRTLFPAEDANTRSRTAAISTCGGVYPGVPVGDISKRLRDDYNCTVLSTESDIKPGEICLKIDFHDTQEQSSH